MALEIVGLTEEHVRPCLQIYNYYILNSTATFSIDPIEEKAFKKLAFSGDERFPSFVLLDDKKVVGYSLLNRYKPREAYDKTAETTIYLDKDQVGKGYGKKALAHLETIAKENSFRALLAVICKENKESIQLYQKFGYFECGNFKQVGEKFGRILDVVIYEKLLEGNENAG